MEQRDQHLQVPNFNIMEKVTSFQNVFGEYPQCVLKVVKNRVRFDKSYTYWVTYSHEEGNVFVYRTNFVR